MKLQIQNVELKASDSNTVKTEEEMGLPFEKNCSYDITYIML